MLPCFQRSLRSFLDPVHHYTPHRPCTKAFLLDAGLGFAETPLDGPSLSALLRGLYLPYSQVPTVPSSVTCHIKYMMIDFFIYLKNLLQRDFSKRAKERVFKGPGQVT